MHTLYAGEGNLRQKKIDELVDTSRHDARSVARPQLKEKKLLADRYSMFEVTRQVEPTTFGAGGWVSWL
jgi:hypothetical protein